MQQPMLHPIALILLPLNGTPTGAAALALGLQLARRFDAHLDALHVGSDSREVAPLAGEGLSGALVEEMIGAAEREAGRRLRTMRALFDRVMGEEAAAGRPVAFRDRATLTDPSTPPVEGPSAGFRTIAGREHERVAFAARLSDLIVVPHADSGDEVSSSEALHAVLFDSGRPVIIAPKVPPESVGRRICIGWNGTAESASAVMSILPWLQHAEAVEVLHSPEYQRQGPEALELVSYLATHGVRASMRQFASIDREVGAGLLAAAGAFGADLLCMGAYSHSRLRQLILGGVTRHVLEAATLPVLMAR